VKRRSNDLIKKGLELSILVMAIELIGYLMIINFFEFGQEAMTHTLTLKIFLLGVLVIPFFEELFFRGILILVVFNLRNQTKKKVMTLNAIQALIFSLMHIPIYSSNDFITLKLILAFIFALIVGQNAIKNKSIVPAFIAHAILNLAYLI
jgi:membrane protease YdiL (CAAX protease family)